jgi:hypothetical protein
MTTKHEDPKNVRDLCAECAPRPDPTLHGHPLPWYVGRHVKRAFRQGDAIEHMWVRVTAVTGTSLTGCSTTNPALWMTLNCTTR